MKVGGSYPAGWLADVGPAARRLEELGYDSAGTGEMAHDPMMLAAAAAMATERIEIGTLAIAFARAPMVLAMGAWDLQQATGGRFSLSLGSQVKGHIQKPLRDALDRARAAHAGVHPHAPRHLGLPSRVARNRTTSARAIASRS